MPPLALFARQPAGSSVSPSAVTYRGRPSTIAQAVEVAAVGRLQRRDERRPPARREAGRAVERAEAGEAGVDDPELAAGAPGHLVDLDVARDVAGAGQEAGVVPAGRVEPGGDGRDVDELPDLDRGADGEPVAVEGQAHRGLEGAEVGVEVVPLVADHHELAGLVGGDQQRRAELPQQRGEVRRVDGPQRRRVLRLGAAGSSVGAAGETAVVMISAFHVQGVALRKTEPGVRCAGADRRKLLGPWIEPDHTVPNRRLTSFRSRRGLPATRPGSPSQLLESPVCNV